MTATTLQADQKHGTVTASTDSFELKSAIVKGRERELVEGFLATTHIDKGNDEFTVNALKSMADDINSDNVDTIDAVFNDVDTEALKEAQVGNLDHNNNPGAPFGDTRTVPAFKVIEADVKDTGDGHKGLWIKAVLNSDGMLPETISAVKNSIKDNFLNAFSIEFLPKKVKQVTKGNKVVRKILDAAAKGAALTGRPMNPAARMTDAMLKSMATEYKVEYAYEVGDNVSWNDTSGTIRDRTKDSCFNERIDGDFEVCGTQEDPAYLIEVDNEEETMVAHKQSLFTEKTDTKQLSEEQRTPPKAAQENAQMALDAREDTGNPNDCGTETGWRRAQQLADGGALSMEVIEAMAQFNRHRDNSDMSDEEGRSDCGWMMWKAWGGDEGVDWAIRMSEKADEMDGKTEEVETKEDFTVQTPDFDATSEASWSKPAMEDFPDDYDVMSIFLARNQESDNFSDQALPVVDWRNGEATLVLEALRSAHDLAPQVDGLSSGEVEAVRNKVEELAEENFDVMIERDQDSEHMEEKTESQNDTTTMTDEEKVEEEVNDEPEPEEGEGDSETEPETEPEEGSEDESADLQEDVADLKSKFKDLKETNESLREENENLKSELEDLKTVQEVKNDLDEIKDMVGEIPLEDGPKVEQEQKRFDGQESEQKEEWKSILDGMADAEGYLQAEGKSKSKLEAFSKRHGVDSQEVKNYVTSN